MVKRSSLRARQAALRLLHALDGLVRRTEIRRCRNVTRQHDEIAPSFDALLLSHGMAYARCHGDVATCADDCSARAARAARADACCGSVALQRHGARRRWLLLARVQRADGGRSVVEDVLPERRSAATRCTARARDGPTCGSV
jgi:hypothetical protein